MASIDDIFSGETLKAADIEGREPTVTIKSVEPKEFDGKDGKRQRKLVISFHNAKKMLVCNKINAQRIAVLHGKDYTQWPGKQITLFVDPFVQFGNEMVHAIRVKPPSGPSPTPIVTPARITTGPQHEPVSEPVPFDDPISIEDTF